MCVLNYNVQNSYPQLYINTNTTYYIRRTINF